MKPKSLSSPPWLFATILCTQRNKHSKSTLCLQIFILHFTIIQRGSQKITHQKFLNGNFIISSLTRNTIFSRTRIHTIIILLQNTHRNRNQSRILTQDLNMSSFLKDTAADFYILYCKFHDLGEHIKSMYINF